MKFSRIALFLLSISVLLASCGDLEQSIKNGFTTPRQRCRIAYDKAAQKIIEHSDQPPELVQAEIFINRVIFERSCIEEYGANFHLLKSL